ncbi:hypothetical protein FRC19_001068 [Serendipita sp. 401]|nr:hypothetical protein FRC19_001068 [Serendipita sp. 401]KAG9048790.1 hypothetical protein FS842_000309 [Serendipita sp. 407]
MNMTDVELRQRLQTSEYNEGLLLIKWINSLDVVERLSDPGLASVPSGQCLLQSAPWAIYRNTPMVAAAAANMMTASLFIAERTEVDTILSLAVKHPSYKQMAVILRLSVSNDVLRACSTSTRKMLAHHLVNAIGRGLKSNGMVHIRGPIVTAHPVTNQQLYRRDCWLEETVQGKVRHQEVLFTYGY